MYVIERDDLYLIPTAEVPVTNLYRDEILPDGWLPSTTPPTRRASDERPGRPARTRAACCACTSSTRSRWSSSWRPKRGADELESLTRDAEAVLEALELPYRTVERCTADLGFAPAKGYDLEAWSPGVGKWLKVSSCSTTPISRRAA